ncbi:MAG: Chaperone SurA [Anaerolineales bacterium]|nr:Chaperone SurA [Anaerolineales bacterium]WKZ45317.1 MAG: peptidylprolyl isomerase [Anaerolineales bacterium]
MSNQSSPPKPATKKHIARLERERRQVRLIRWIVFGCIALVAGIIGYGYLDLNYLQLNDPVAEVNGEIITTRQWQERVQVQRYILLNQYNQAVFQQNFGIDTSQQQQSILLTMQQPILLGQQALDALVDETLIRQQAKKLGITVSEQEVDEAIQSAYNFFPNGTETPAPTATEFALPTLSSQQLTLYPSTATPTKFLTPTPTQTSTPDPAVTSTATATQAPPTPTFVPLPATATATPYTLDGFNNVYATSVASFDADGISEKTLRSIYEANLLREKVFEAVTADTPHTEEQVWARHILVEDARTSGIVRSLLIGGKDFAEAAKEFSKDTGSGMSGGDLGWFGRGMMVAEFENAAFSQKVGEIGEPVQSQFGYHIIQVLGHTDVPLSESQYEQKRQTEFSEWLEQVKKDSAILIHEEWRDRVPPAPAGFGQQ